ncbi:MAG: ADP-ribosylglycohydrolase family protein [Clostridia bacterium]|nr:ADP-ribosylglycohydrolase family protein [Clostridia bacterium]
MIGALIGDIAGSRFEWNNHRSKEFEFFAKDCLCTDDSIMSIAAAKALLESDEDFTDLSAQAVRWMREVGRRYPEGWYSRRFKAWLMSEDPQPYEARTNGAAMRVSACAYAARSLEEAKHLSRAVTEITHNHPEGIKGAEAVTVAVYMARTGSTMEQIREVIDREYYPMDFTLDGIRESYAFDYTCEGSVPQAFMAFFESVSVEDAIRNAISIGGDSDTIAAIAGAVAGAYYGVPDELRGQAIAYMDEGMREILFAFEAKFMKA